MQPTTRPISTTVTRRLKIRCRPQSSTLLQNRSFTCSTHASGQMQQSRMPKDIMSKIPKQQAMKSKMQNINKTEMPDDFGFLPQTFVYGPATSDYPTFLGDIKIRTMIEWYRIKQALQGFITTYYMCRWGVNKHPETNKRITKPLLLRERGSAARDLHQKFYTALADGDMAKISETACKGLVDRARVQVAQRNASKRSPQNFRIQRYNGWNPPQWLPWPFANLLPFQSTRVLADKMVPIPIGQNSWIRQCVIRLRTTQTLDKGSDTGSLTKSLTEYIVTQKLCINGQEQPWKLWGTVEPSSTFQVFEAMDAKFSPGSTFASLVKEKMGQMTGGMM